MFLLYHFFNQIDIFIHRINNKLVYGGGCEMEWHLDNYKISDDPAQIDYQAIHRWLSGSYWAEGRSREKIEASCQKSLCFCMFYQERQIGFARVVTDYAVFAWICDVVIDPGFRGRGLGKWLMEKVLEHPVLQNTAGQLLATRDAHGLYEKYGFARAECMRRKTPEQ
jgi:GNAT superfamily N-acetyltransferase